MIPYTVFFTEYVNCDSGFLDKNCLLLISIINSESYYIYKRPFCEKQRNWLFTVNNLFLPSWNCEFGQYAAVKKIANFVCHFQKEFPNLVNQSFKENNN